MKYVYVLPVALMLLLVSCKSDKKETDEAPIDPKQSDLYTYKLNGKVKSFSEHSYSYEGGKKGAPTRETPGNPDTEVQFNEKGMVTSDKSYNNGAVILENIYNGKKKPVKEIQYINGKTGIITDYQYNKDGNETSKIRRTDSNGQVDRIENIYKGKNLVEKNTYNNQNTLIDKITYAHDKKGNIVEENIYMGTQAVKVRAVYEYDDKGQKVLETRYSSGKISYKTLYGYDGNKVISKVTVNDKGQVEYSEKFVYDANGNVVKFMQFEKSSSSESEEVNTYDAHNNLISAVITNNGKIQHKELYAYDKNNNIISVMVTDGSGKIITNKNYAYTYDSHQNWTKKVINVMGEPAFIVERTLTYYE